MDNIIILQYGILFSIVFFNYSNSTVNDSSISCPPSCRCEITACPKDLSSVCEQPSGIWNAVQCTNFSDDILSQLPVVVNSLSISSLINSSDFENILKQSFPNLRSLFVSFMEDDLILNSSGFHNEKILQLSFSEGNFKTFPHFVEMFPNLKVLNVSNNAMEGEMDISISLRNLKVIDLSQNLLTRISLRGKLDQLQILNLQKNHLKHLPKLYDLSYLEVLDISYNNLLFDDFYTSQEEVEIGRQNCAIFLPNSLETLILRGNFLQKIPSENCNLFTGLPILKHIDLGDNSLGSISSDDFPLTTRRTLLSLIMDGNDINYLSQNAFDGFTNLKSLIISNNQIRNIPFEVFEGISRRMSKFPSHDQAKHFFMRAEGNPMSCDCTQEKVQEFLQIKNQTVISPDDMVCYYPLWLYGTAMINVKHEHLECVNTTLRKPKNATCNEYSNCNISCIFDGLPHPQTDWISPTGQLISVDTISDDASLRALFDLSSDGQKLTIKDLHMHETGTYRCIGNNGYGNATGYIRVGAILQPIGSILAIVVSAVSFLIAIVLNSVNLCHYYCQHLREKRAIREAEAMPFKMESPVKSKQKGLHESEASLNANKYYRKYDFTCQQVFLDTVIKGAHTVKRTLYDARNSEFSNNVWEYASHLRDRLHIELPTSMQLPRVSMPSISMPTISMPNISMPSMPNFQSINTNIEKLGTSVMNRSHTLATSVGSVFTMRWLRSGNSDNESDSDLESAGVSHSEILVHVHKCQDGSSSQPQQSSSENSPYLPRLPKYLGSSWLRRKTSRYMQTSQDDTDVPRRTKSVRFAEVDRPQTVAKLQRSASYSNISSSISASVNVEEQLQDDRVISVVCVNVPVTYQFETTV